MRRRGGGGLGHVKWKLAWRFVFGGAGEEEVEEVEGECFSIDSSIDREKALLHGALPPPPAKGRYAISNMENASPHSPTIAITHSARPPAHASPIIPTLLIDLFSPLGAPRGTNGGAPSLCEQRPRAKTQELARVVGGGGGREVVEVDVAVEVED